MISKEELIQFEEEIAQLFLDKQILSPIHLSKGNEEQLIEIFDRHQIDHNDWVFSTHRSHYHALLKGIPKEWLREEILKNRSIHIFNKEHKFFSSAIVGGVCPIAVGVAYSLTLHPPVASRVFCFIGDMAAETGIFHECWKYSNAFCLPLTFIVEDNGFSTNTPTKEVWRDYRLQHRIVDKYGYKRGYPHVGVGPWVTF